MHMHMHMHMHMYVCACCGARARAWKERLRSAAVAAVTSDAARLSCGLRPRTWTVWEAASAPPPPPPLSSASNSAPSPSPPPPLPSPPPPPLCVPASTRAHKAGAHMASATRCSIAMSSGIAPPSRAASRFCWLAHARWRRASAAAMATGSCASPSSDVTPPTTPASRIASPCEATCMAAPAPHGPFMGNVRTQHARTMHAPCTHQHHARTSTMHAPCMHRATTAHLRQCAERPDALLAFGQAGGGQHALHAAAPVQAHRPRADAPLPVAVRLLSSAAAALEAASSDQHVRALRSSGCCTLLIDITLREVEREPEILEEVHALSRCRPRPSSRARRLGSVSA
eukprot:scaffold30495_cov71-Phaeocystis_antarctica.AAC.6